MFDNPTLIHPDRILQVNANDFENIALQVFNYQYHFNAVYRDFCNALHINPSAIDKLTNIPFLPISFFKTHKVWTHAQTSTSTRLHAENEPNAELIFESSGTTGELTSRHYVTDASIYERSLIAGFEQFYGDPREYAILALLPAYLERKNASLVHMAKTLMEKSGHPDNGFYINEWEQLHEKIVRLEKSNQKILLLGVTFALIDFAEAWPGKLVNTIVMETGGMKGRKREMTRSEVHSILTKQWGLKEVHSEYGMTELLSQAYAVSNGIFKCTNTMKVLARDINDPFDISETSYGCLNIIDLANINSCSFIATEDIGEIADDGSFDVLGRMDHSALRGCSLMVI